ncbi:hypothetical protein IGI04_039276 [Brassica rapa subsp. trilocularis]|uniref:Uncharacterized protein n=1 Tax=Brassica rapa subsp. trilocularis TaxID=1813537 RepID=A0ABQ7KMD9_BRACM|nr:hypothetical protein IGI04_039276 [Brassica rapa subsp. trilocularis]
MSLRATTSSRVGYPITIYDWLKDSGGCMLALIDDDGCFGVWSFSVGVQIKPSVESFCWREKVSS